MQEQLADNENYTQFLEGAHRKVISEMEHAHAHEIECLLADARLPDGKSHDQSQDHTGGQEAGHTCMTHAHHWKHNGLIWCNGFAVLIPIIHHTHVMKFAEWQCLAAPFLFFPCAIHGMYLHAR